MSPKNRAAYIPSAHGRLEVRDAPYSTPGEHEMIIRVGYVAINPVEWKVQQYNFLIQQYPHILGSDVAGKVVEVGKGVDEKKFAVGQRVISHARGLGTLKPEDGGFQLFVRILDKMTIPIPSSLPLTNASVIPLGLGTATASLFLKTNLDLPLPSLEPVSAGKTVLIWGGSSSVGCMSIQLAIAAGVEVITVASKKNHDLMKELGAKYIFDQTEADVEARILDALKGKEFAGAVDCITAPATIEACARIASKAGGKKHVAIMMYAPPGLSIPEDVKVQFVTSLGPHEDEPEIGKAVWGGYVPAALEKGVLKAKPDPEIVGKGLESIQDAMDIQQKGVSAKKVVVEIAGEL